MKITVRVNSNIALVKYWGKRNKKLMLPLNSNLSMTFDKLNTITTVEFDKKYKKDIFILDGKKVNKGKVLNKTIKHLDIIRKMAGIKTKAKIASQNNFPTAAGLASSASGFAALSLAATRAAGIKLNTKELSMLSRLGSGSATRSCLGGFVQWKKGTKKDGSDSYAVQIAKPNHWPTFRIVIAIVSKTIKKISSTKGMELTVKTCPLYPGWLNTVEKDLKKVKQALLKRDFTTVGSTAEHNCLKMHATMMTTQPPLMYWSPETIRIIKSIHDWRDQGLEAYFTIDAGPQVKVICLKKDAKKIEKKLKKIKGVKKTIICQPGGDPKIINKHLF